MSAETFENLDYVRRYYGVPAEVGQRVIHEGRDHGVVLGGKGGHVAVRFDGEQHASSCHPLSLDYGDGTTPEARQAEHNALVDRFNDCLNGRGPYPTRSECAGEGEQS